MGVSEMKQLTAHMRDGDANTHVRFRNLTVADGGASDSFGA